MQSILVEVEDEVSKVYSKIPRLQRTQIDYVISNWLKLAIARTHEKDFLQLLVDIREEARKNGLTEEILQKILSENDD